RGLRPGDRPADHADPAENRARPGPPLGDPDGPGRRLPVLSDRRNIAPRLTPSPPGRRNIAARTKQFTAQKYQLCRRRISQEINQPADETIFPLRRNIEATAVC